MLQKTISVLFQQHGLRHISRAAIKPQPEKLRGIQLINCKRKQFDLYSNDFIDREADFGDLPLASSGWKHYKSKGDFFVINPTSNVGQFCVMVDIDRLKSCGTQEVVIQNLRERFEISALTTIQDAALLKILDMNHVLIAAETGCGKTLAYLVPIVQQILHNQNTETSRGLNSPIALVILPGRELATQVGNVAEKLCDGTGLKVKTILGGRVKKTMLDPEFEDVDILVSSFGALSKLVTTGIYKMNHVRHVVLDEADTLLDDSFSQKLGYFLKRFPFHKNHLQGINDNTVGTQLILASATMPTNVSEMLSQIIDVETIHDVVSPNLHRLMPHIKHKFLRMGKSERPSNLLNIVKQELNKHRPVIVFSNKSATSDFVSLFLNNEGLECVNLNGDMAMIFRLGQFEKFQTGEVHILSTTDVGSRGLDTTRANHIINFDFPLHIADYIHRSGRIGRVGCKGSYSITNFVSSLRELDIVQKIEHTARTGGVLPNVNANITNIINRRIQRNIERLEKIVE